jgi:hypothetical protein
MMTVLLGRLFEYTRRLIFVSASVHKIGKFHEKFFMVLSAVTRWHVDYYSFVRE